MLRQQRKKVRTFVFSFKTNTTREALRGAQLQRPYVDVAAPTSHGVRIAGLQEPTGVDDARADDAHRLPGHMELDATRAAAARSPGKQIEFGVLEKAGQKNVNKEADALKEASKPNGC